MTRTGAARIRRALPAALLIAFFAVFLAYPVAHVFRGALLVDGRLSLAAFRQALDNQVFVASLWNSLWVAALVTFLSSLVSFPLAHLFVHYEFRGKGVLQGLLLSALVLPPFVAAIGMRQLFARFGSINLALLELGVISEPIDFLGANPLAGVVLMETLHLYPILFLNLIAALAGVDPSLDEAAQGMGASWRTRFLRVTLPLVLPGYFAGAVIVFIFALTDLGTPIVFDARDMVAMQIFERAVEGSRDPVGYALVLVVLVLSLLLFLLGRRAVAQKSAVQATKGTVAARTRRVPALMRPLLVLGLGLLVFVTLLPHAAIALVAFSEKWFFTVLPERFSLVHFERVLTDEVAFLGVKNSLVYASCATLLDVVLGVAIAWLAVRRGGRLGAALDACAMLPLALPGVVLAFGYAMCYAGTPLGDYLDPLQDPFLLIVIGYSVRRLPYVVRSADAGFRQVPVALEEASRNLGATGATTLRRVTLPLLAGNLLAGALLAFSFAMLEVSESLILAPAKEDFPIAKAIYQLLGDIQFGAQIGCAMGVIGAALLLYSLIAASRLLGRSLGELFRA
ncbi:MAG: iron ABC transporter permease [Planctomycetes bacterium]|nr:iron ABC transporter permease [Planctomycetota bacterium]